MSGPAVTGVDHGSALTGVGATDLAGGDLSGGNAVWTERYSHAVMGTFGPPRRVLVRGEGAWVWDADGRRYLDLLGGIAVNSLGHAHPMVVAAVTSQLTTLGHISNVFASRPQIALAEALVDLLGAREDGRVFFTNSGTEAVEAAFKIARRTGRPRIVAAQGAFHGRTLGALALTWKRAYRDPFEPLPGPVDFVPYGEIAALEAAVGEDTAAVVLEPIQGEAGVLPAPDGYLAAAREITARHGTLLIIDEVQTGIGRTGDWFAHTRHGITPDVVTLAKGLGAGIPIGACVARGPAASLLGPGQHGTTFGGNPVASAAGLAVLHTIARDDLLTHVRAVGEQLRSGVLALGHPLVAQVRGEGLLLGVVLTRPVAGAVAAAALDAGYIVGDVTSDVIRLAPPLILGAQQVDAVLTDLPRILDRATGEVLGQTTGGSTRTGGIS